MPGTAAQTTAAIEQALAGWLPGQRWFGGKGSEITGLTVTEDALLAGGDGPDGDRPASDGPDGDGLSGAVGEPALWHLIVRVVQDDGTDDYQVLVGLRPHLPERLEHAVIGVLPDGRVAYDALHDHDLTAVLLRDMIGQADRGAVRLRSVSRTPFEGDPGGGADLESLVLTGEQSNTSLVFGEEAILKVFRRVSPGPNPDLEVSAALARLGSTHVAEPYGWMETGKEGGDPAEVTVLAILSQYLRASTDGWTLAATSVRDLYADPETRAADAGGDFDGEARRLGAATAEVHRDLVTAFGQEELPPGAGADLAAGMRRRLDEAVTTVPVLRDHAGLLGQAYDALAAYAGPVPVQRIHGDYHLGQAMRTLTDWVLLDFEGEPAVPLATRRALFSPLRDVAGMLRSFDYAARHQLLDNPNRETLELTARDWVRRNSDAFCAGYAEAGGSDPRDSAVLLRAFQLDKAVYEVLYEARNRPSWLPIPLDSLAALASAGVKAPVSRAGDGS
ncbi:MAG TPA: aminoglycoside phosphotransferase [Streptosporangiaceae bacterium]|jgi:maltokinase